MVADMYRLFVIIESWVGKCVKTSTETVQRHNPRPTQRTKYQRYNKKPRLGPIDPDERKAMSAISPSV